MSSYKATKAKLTLSKKVCQTNKSNRRVPTVVLTKLNKNTIHKSVDGNKKPIKNILLYNLFHLGDLLFSQPLIYNLCVNNPHIHFTLAVKYCTFLFCEIPNLQLVVINNHDELEKNITTPFFALNCDTIAVNLWIFAMAYKDWNLCHLIEASLPDMCQQFISIVHTIQKHYNIKINFLLYDLPELLPILPRRTDISEFEYWLRNSGFEKTILYFNYNPMSGQEIPVQDHNNIILQLSNLFKNSAIILPKISDCISSMRNPNIIDAQKVFNCQQIEPMCEHLCKLGKITLLCTYAIIFDIGACYFHVNRDFINSNVKIIHVSTSDNYFQKIQSHWKKLPENRMIFLRALNDDQIINKLQTIILN